MPKKRYTEDEKEHARQCLMNAAWDVPLISLQLGIPERTLYRWKNDWQKNIFSLPTRQTAFGMTREELEDALQAEYISGVYTDLRETLLEHIHNLAPTLSDDPDLAHRRVLAITRLLDRVIQLEKMVRIERPTVQVIKYEYPDETYHEVPYWSNAVYNKAQKAYDTVIERAKREYYRQQGVDYNEMLAQIYNEEPDWETEYVLQEVMADNFSPEDFEAPQHTGILGAVLNKNFDSRTANHSPSANSLPEDDGTNANDNSLSANPLPKDDGTIANPLPFGDDTHVED